MKKKLKNRFEKRIYGNLKRAKAAFGYEVDRIPYVLCKHYIPDFRIVTPTGILYVECKGYLRPEDRSKMAAIKRQHPEKDIRILFYGRNSKYIKWADKLGFKWAINTIPKEWLSGL